MTGDLRQDFLHAMSRAAASVHVITTDGPGGRAGLTASAVTSVSADTAKPSLLVCLNRASRSAAAILENGVFCVNLLGHEQQALADAFAGRSTGDRFALGRWIDGPTGSPVLADALAAWDCRITRSDLVGSHHVLIGQAEQVWLNAPRLPLIYANRGYLPMPAAGCCTRNETA
ncbi:MAG: flavin reductase [Gemmobacter sp.]|uniref:flavin reductase n=1 Tax=Gemmobacter sp. TaxID=1898957 RepID=UPI00391A40E9